MDRDGDGILTVAELPEPVAERFEDMLSRADRNNDQQVSEAEFLDFQSRVKKLQQRAPSDAQVTQQVNQLLRRADRDDDGQLTRRETPRFLAARFEKVDADSNGRLDREELSRMAGLFRLFRQAATPSANTRKRPAKRPK